SPTANTRECTHVRGPIRRASWPVRGGPQTGPRSVVEARADTRATLAARRHPTTPAGRLPSIPLRRIPPSYKVGAAPTLDDKCHAQLPFRFQRAGGHFTEQFMMLGT